MFEPRMIFHPFPVNLRVSAEKLVAPVVAAGNRLDSGGIFVFFNRKRDQCRIVWHDGEGLCTLEKVLQTGTFAAVDQIHIGQSIIDDFFTSGFNGQAELLHALRGNLSYLDDVRKPDLD